MRTPDRDFNDEDEGGEDANDDRDTLTDVPDGIRLQ